MSVSHYPSGGVAAVVNSEDLSLCFYDDLPRKQCLASFKLGIGFCSYQDGTPRAVFSASGGCLCSPTDGSATESWEWKTSNGPASGTPLSIALNSYLQLTCENKHDITVTFRSGKGASGTEAFQCGAPGRADHRSYLDEATRDVTGALKVTLDPSKHPTLVQRQRLVSDPAKAAVQKAQRLNDSLPRLSSSGRELAGLELPPSLLVVRNNHAWSTGPLAAYTTDIGQKVQLIKEKTTREGMKTLARIASGRLPPADPLNDTAMTTTTTAAANADPLVAPAARQKRLTPKRAPLATIPGRKLETFVQALRSDQLCVVVATDKTSRDCRNAERVMKEYISAATNRVLQQRQVCATEVDLSAIIGELEASVVLTECLTDKTLPKKYGFNLFPMFLFFCGGRLVFLGNRFNNGVCSLSNFEIQLAKSINDARNSAFLPDDYALPTLADASFASIF